MTSFPDRDPTGVISGWLAALNGHDQEGALALSHPDLVFRPLIVSAPGLWLGHEGLRRLMSDVADREAVLAEDERNVVEVNGIEALEDGRFIAFLVLQPANVGCVGVYEVEDDRVLSAHHAFSDPELLAQVGAIPEMAVRR